MSPWPLTAVADANGNATAQLPNRAIGQRWKISFITLQSDSTTASIASVILNNQFLIGSSRGNFDSASGDPPIIVTGKDTLSIQWQHCSTGAKCTAILWYDDTPMQKAS